MSPLDSLLASDLTLPAVIVCAVVLVAWIGWQIKTYHRPSQPPRVRPEPVEEIDFGAAIENFIGANGRTRTAIALARSSKEMGPAPVGRPDPMTTTHGGSHEQQYAK